jgi:hypothetical protein
MNNLIPVYNDQKQRIFLIFFLWLICTGIGNAAQQSTSISSPTEGQAFVNKDSIYFDIKVYTAMAYGNIASLVLHDDQGSRIISSTTGGIYCDNANELYGAEKTLHCGPWTYAKGDRWAYAELFVNKVLVAKSETVNFSIVRQPNVAIESFYPTNGITINGNHLTISAQAETTVIGGLTSNEYIQLSLYVDNNSISSQDFSGNQLPAKLKKDIDLASGTHTLKVEAKFIDTTTTQQTMATDPKLATFTVNGSDKPCDGGGVCNVSDANSSITINGFAIPGIVNDGFGYNQKIHGGLLEWKIDGVNRMFSQWHWFRIGNANKEIAVGSDDHLDFNDQGITFTQDVVTKQIVLNYDLPNYPIGIELRYTLLGGTPKSFNSILDYDVFVTNKTTNPLDIEWFVYNDLDLTPAGFEDTIKALLPDGAMIKQTTCLVDKSRFIQPRLVVTNQQSMPQEAYALDIFTGHTVENGGRKNVLYELSDNAITNLAGFNSQDGNIVEDRIYAKQYTLEGILPNERREITGILRMDPFARGDLNCDGKLDFSTDYPVFLGAFGGQVSSPGIEPDYNGDGFVGLADYATFRNLFKK